MIPNVAAARLPRPSTSNATPAAISAVSGPLEAGIRSNAYVEPEPLKLLTEAFETVTSDAVKPLTLLVNTIVTGTGDNFVGVLDEVLSVTEGDSLSMV